LRKPIELVPETMVHANGSGPVLEATNELFQITLAISEVVEQESLELHVHGSPDGITWSAKPILVFPQKFYAGLSTLLLDLKRYPEMRFLQARWKVNRWGRGDLTPKFTFFVVAEPLPELMRA
jgi:hypothetical protein